PSLPEHRHAAGGGASLALAVPLDQVAGHLLGALRSIGVALCGLDDRALHEDVERTREFLSVPESGLLGKRAQDGADVLEMLGARSAGGMLGVGRLGHHVDDRATLDVLTVEPHVEEVEDREEPPLAWRAAI